MACPAICVEFVVTSGKKRQAVFIHWYILFPHISN